MCGIIGVVKDGASASRDRLVAARGLMRHRGPNDAGVWAGEHACVGAQRLSIIDTSDAGHQPFVSDDRQVVLVFNGEIYNYRALRKELERDFAFHSHTDTEVLLHGYRKWGADGLLPRLDGMFAFALWDDQRHRLFAARDRAGKKPFYFRHEGRQFHFASTLNALLAFLPGTPPLDPHAIDAYLVYQAVPGPLSIFRDVRQLRPAHSLVFDADSGACRESRYWHVSYATKTRESEEEVLAHVERLAREAVKKRLVSDVPVGVFLSGGVDSSLVAALASQESERPIEAVTVGFEESEFDERHYARRVAQHLGMPMHEEMVRPALVADLPAIVWHYGQPVADVSIVPNHYLARAAHRWMTVALNGDGGDELFGGYTRPILARLAVPYRAFLPGPLRRALGRLFRHTNAGPFRRVALLARAGAVSAAEAFTYDRAFRPFRDEAYPELFKQLVAGAHPDALYRSVWDECDGLDDIDRALYGDFNTYLPDQLLPRADRASMAHSLEARSPLLDTALIEYAATIPNDMRLRGFETKHLLKRLAARFVPREVLYRRKRGFVMPASRWLRGELAPFVRAALDNRTFFDRGWVRPEFVRRVLAEHFTGVTDWGEQIWTLLVLEVWARLVLDRTLDRDARMDDFLRKPERARRAILRTLQVGMEWFPEKPGGLNRVYFELMRHLPDAGVEVHGLVAGTAKVATDSRGMIEGFAPHSERLAPRLLAVRRLAGRLLRSDPAVLVVSHFALYTAPILDEMGDHPLVVHFQGPWGLEGRAERQAPSTVLAKTAVEGMVYRRAKAFIVLSAPFGRILETRFGIPAERIHVIPGGVDVPRFAITESREECRRLLGWPTDRPIVLAVRRLMRRMGLDDLVASVVQLREAVPDVLVLIAGRGPIAGELQQQIDALGLADHVRLLGFVPDEALPRAYRAADITIVPTVALEGFGLIVAESFAAGTPCLVTPVGGLPDAVTGLSPHLVLKDVGPRAIADGLAAALTGRLPLPDARTCLQYARRHYDWPVIAERTRLVYEEAMR
ncbi:MAG: asparagine synthase (glutamine-hydrolyzing) [Gemmatimonadetes bacterium]|nr:asparagine synthase (glutamine-hydrolyzing) [Gemmatimonadota bacterium]